MSNVPELTTFTLRTACGTWERFRRDYLPLQRPDEVKLDADDVTRICRLVDDHDLHTQYVADRYDVSQRRVQQLAKECRDTGEIPTIETPGRRPYAEYPLDLIERILKQYELHEQGATGIAHILRERTASRSTTTASTQFSRSTTMRPRIPTSRAASGPECVGNAIIH